MMAQAGLGAWAQQVQSWRARQRRPERGHVWNLKLHRQGSNGSLSPPTASSEALRAHV